MNQTQDLLWIQVLTLIKNTNPGHILFVLGLKHASSSLHYIQGYLTPRALPLDLQEPCLTARQNIKQGYDSLCDADLARTSHGFLDYDMMTTHSLFETKNGSSNSLCV